jgi:hypothetical protein
MSKVRMFGDEKEELVSSPRTTIVGGRPPEEQGELPAVPTGIQQLLRLAAVDRGFCEQLLERRDDVASAAAVELTASERAILRVVPAAQLARMASSMPPPSPDRRTFLRETASSAVLLLGGAALATTQIDCSRGTRPDQPPPRPGRNETTTTAGVSPEPPPPRPDARVSGTKGGAEPSVPEEVPTAGARAVVPRRQRREMETSGGEAPDVPPEKPK